MATIARSLCIGVVVLAGAVECAAEPLFTSPNISGSISEGSNIGYDLTPDGRYVLFTADDDDMIAGDTNGMLDLIIRDRMTNTNELITPGVSLGTRVPSAGECLGAMSADGRYVVFQSVYNVIPGVADRGAQQIYVRDRVLQQTFLISRNDAGEPLEADSLFPTISDDGRYVAFISAAASIAQGEEGTRTYLVDRQSGARRIVSRNRGGDTLNIVGNGPRPFMSGDGRWIVFATSPLLPEAGQTTHVYLYDRNDDSLKIISRTPAGDLGSGPSNNAVISRDGRYIAFVSAAPNLTGQPVGDEQVLRLNRVTGAIDKVEFDRLGNQLSNGTFDPPVVTSLSATGRYLAFASSKRLIAGIPPFLIGGGFVRDMESSRSVVANVDRLGRRVASGGPLTEDGRFVMMAGSDAMFPQSLSVPNSKLGSSAASGDVFLEDLSAVDVSVRLVETTTRSIVDAVVENHSTLQASLVALHLTSSPAVPVGVATPDVCDANLLPRDCWNIFLAAGQQVTVHLPFNLNQVATAVDLDVVLEPNEVDPNLANNSAHFTIAAPPAPPPPPSNSGGGGSGGGGGAFGWVSAALLLSLRAVSSRRRRRLDTSHVL